MTQAEIMLETTIALLDKMTAVDGIASEGYRYGLLILKGYQRHFADQNAVDGTYLTKFLHTISNVQQIYFKYMLKFVNEKYPLIAANPTMKGFMVRQINKAYESIDMGIVHQSPLPATLLDYGKPRPPSGDKTTTSDKKKTGDNPAWWKTNPAPVPDWLLPTGKKFKAFFDISTADGRANVSCFPMVNHHNPEVAGLRYVCTAYHGVAKRAHLPASKMIASIKAQCTNGFTMAYNS